MDGIRSEDGVSYQVIVKNMKGYEEEEEENEDEIEVFI